MRIYEIDLLACIFHTPAELLINTGTLARCKETPGSGELFQQFVTSRGKPLKRLTYPSISLHRTKAPVLMRSGSAQSWGNSVHRRFIERRCARGRAHSVL